MPIAHDDGQECGEVWSFYLNQDLRLYHHPPNISRFVPAAYIVTY